MACKYTQGIVSTAALTEEQNEHLAKCEECREALASRENAPSFSVTGDVVTATPDPHKADSNNDASEPN